MDRNKIRKIAKRQETIVAAFSLIVFIFFSVFSDNFFTPTNLKLILQQYAVNGICVLGISIVVILGGIDLSAGAVLAMAGSVAGTLVKAGSPVVVCVLAGIGAGMVCSLINAIIITKCRVPAIITTTASNYMFRGLIVVVTGGYWVNQFPREFTEIGTGRILGISNIFWMAMILLLIMSVFMKYFNTGRKIYAVGTNPQGADLSGISSDKIQIIGYMICGALIGFAGVMYAASYGAINPSSTGLTVGTTILAAALAGGVNFGGKGTLLGGAIGMMMITIINNGLIQVKVSEYWVDAITGAIILIALILNVLNVGEKRRGEE